MGELGVDKLILIFVVVLLLFGARRLPEVGASLGKGIRELKRGLTDASAPTSDADASQPAEPRRLESSASAPPDAQRGDPKRLPNGGHA